MTSEERPRRTQALRGPGAGGFTPPQSLAASNPCLNCGTNIQLEFCPECGQRAIDADPTLREFLHEVAEEFLHWDGKLFKTFRTLLTRPGELTRHYVDGRRVRFISPIRVYLTCSVLFFFLSAIAPKRVVIDRAGRAVEQGVAHVSGATAEELASLDAQAREAPALQRLWLTKFARAVRSPERLQGAIAAATPKAMFVLVPLFAALVGMVYRDRRKRFPQHLAFALHVHAALFLALTVMLAGRLLPSITAAGVLQLLVLVPFAMYAVRATRVVYEGSRAQTVWRLTLVSAMYFVTFMVTMAILFAASVLVA